VWTMWEHYAALTDPGTQRDYLAVVCLAIRLAAVNLAACKDDVSKLQCPSSEDDNIPPTQGLQGAETVLLALNSAVAAAGPCQFDAGEVAGWQTRATELAQAIRNTFVVAGHFEGGRPAWVIWPVGLLDPREPLARSHADWL